MPVPDFSSYRTSSYADAKFYANDKQSCIIIGCYRVPLDKYFIYFCCFSEKNVIKGGISRWSAQP